MASSGAVALMMFHTMERELFRRLDYRSLFITFSRGYPIRQDDIINFFNSLYGPCVESVMVEKAAAGQLPVYGRVVLRCPSMIPVVLDGQQTAKYMIKGRHLWARIYVPSSKPN
uniref:RRM domain-containing protein n=1 Tax=Oryza barthii TaxID=65489 RepID=A0A0D3HGL6_9ORYZ